MKTIIKLMVILLTSVGLIVGVGFFRYLELGSTTNASICFVIACVFGYGIYYSFQLDKKRIAKEEVELKDKIEHETWLALQRPEPYELQPSFAFFMTLFTGFLFLGISPLFFAYKWILADTNSGLSTVPLMLIALGLLLGFLFAYRFFHLAGKPVIRIDENGIHHYMMEFIAWKDVIEMYLRGVNIRSSKNFTLEVTVQNPLLYRSKFKGLLRRYHKGSTFPLQLPVSEENARIVGSVAKAFAVRANAPILDTKLAKIKSMTELQEVLLAEMNPENLSRSLENSEQLMTLSKEVLTTLQIKREKLSKSLKQIKYFFIGAVIVIAIFVYFAIKKTYN